MNQDNFEVLESFLQIPLENADGVFEKFMVIPGHIFRGEGQHRFLYVRGARSNKVVLVAHGDTFWDSRGVFEASPSRETCFEDGKFLSMSAEHGIGADDRAGCAILWLLRHMGHSLLITDGEEQGQVGAKWLMADNPDIAEEINSDHQFMVQFDRRQSRDFKCYGVGTDEFRSYVSDMTGYFEPNRTSYTDIVTLCRRIAGVNLSIGYYNEHTDHEILVYKEWEHTLNLAARWLSADGLPLHLLD
jgi:hypothetical protein